MSEKIRVATPYLLVQPLMNALATFSLVGDGMGIASTHLEALHRMVNRYFIPSDSSSGPTMSMLSSENLDSGVGYLPMPGVICLVGLEAWQG